MSGFCKLLLYAAQLDLDSLLQEIADTAAELVAYSVGEVDLVQQVGGAQYAQKKVPKVGFEPT